MSDGYFTPATPGPAAPETPAAPPAPPEQPTPDAPAQAAVAHTGAGSADPPPEELIPANQPPWLRTVIASLHKRLTALEDKL